MEHNILFLLGKKEEDDLSPSRFRFPLLVGTHQLLRINFFLCFIIINFTNFNNLFYKFSFQLHRRIHPIDCSMLIFPHRDNQTLLPVDHLRLDL